MNPIFDTFRPAGFHSLNAYIFVADPEQLISFLKEAFFAEEIDRTLDDSGEIIRNCIMKIGDSCFMLSQASEHFANMRTSFYLFVNDVDTVFKQAIRAGGRIVFEPADMDYGDRQGGIEDPAGNYWWISTRLTQENYS